MTASTIQDIFEVTIQAFNIAETYRTPVILLFDEIIGHMREKLILPEPGKIPLVERLRTSVKSGIDYHPYLQREDGRLPMSDFGEQHRYNVTGLFHDMWGFPSTKPKIVHGLLRHLNDKITNYAETKPICMYKEFYLEGAEIILISYGSSARSVLHTVKNRQAAGEKIGFIELQTLWPFPYNIIKKKCANARHVIVVEMNMGQMIRAVKNAVEDPKKVFLINRIDGLLITVSDIRNILRMLQGKGV